MSLDRSGLTPRSIHLFAHRGGMAHRRENTLEAFTFARTLGIRGVETDVWLSRDGQPVLHHDGRVRVPGGRRRIAELARADLPTHIPSLEDLYAQCGTDMEIAMDILDPAAALPVVRTALRAGNGAVSRLWLCGPNVDMVASWRGLHEEIHLVHSDREWNRHHRPDMGAHVRQLRECCIDVLNLQHRSCSPAVVGACHEQRIALFAWGVRRVSTMQRLLRMGVDGMMSDHVDRLLRVIRVP
jgi:glycerophosphoryl diester phosphodiesterase